MATNNRDVELRIAASATGNEQIEALAKQLTDLAKEGGEAGPAFEKLSAEVKQLGQQAAAVNAFKDLEAEVGKTAATLTSARAKVDALGLSFTEQAAKTDAFKQAQLDARLAVEATETKLRAAQAALNTFKAGQDAASRSTVGYKTTLGTLRTAVADLENTLADQKALVASKGQYKEVEAELAKTAKAFTQAKREASGLEAQLTSQNTKIDASKVALGELGIAATDAAQAQILLQQNATKVQAAVNSQITAYDRAETETRALAQAQKVLDDELKLQAGFMQAASAASIEAAAADRAAAQAKREATIAIQQQVAAVRQSMDAAFTTLGIRSTVALQAEIAKINAALNTLAGNTRISGAEFDRAFASGKQRIAELEAEINKVPGALNKVGKATTEATSLTSVLKQSFSQFAAAYGAFQAGTAFLDANIQMETLRRTLTLTTGSVEGANAQIQFLKDTANRTGLSVSKLANDFTLFSASAGASGVTLEQQQVIFGNVANAASKMGISTERVGLILGALAQTASKGKLTMEELRGQLGDSLPAALKIVADGFGVTSSELEGLVKKGIDSIDFFEAFSAGASKAFGNDTTTQVEGLGASLARLKNQATELATSIGDGGGTEGLVAAFKGFGLVIGAVGVGLNGIFSTVIAGAKQVGVVVAALVTRDFTNLRSELGRINDKLIEDNTRVATSYATLLGIREKDAVAQTRAATVAATAATTAVAAATQTADATSKAAASSEKLATAADKTAVAQTGAAAAATSQAAAQVDVNTSTSAAAAGAAAATKGIEGQSKATGKLATLNTKLLDSNEGLLESLDELRSNAKQVNASYVQLTLRYDQLAEAADKNADNSKKLAEAKKTEGEASVRLAQITGDEKRIRDASTASANAYAQAVGKTAEALQIELTILRQQKTDLEAAARASGNLSAAKKEELGTLQQLIDKKTVEAEKSQQSARLAKDEAAARDILSQSYKDNSANVDLFRTAVEKTSAEMSRVSRLYAEGKASLDQLDAATRAAAGSQALLRDALADVEKVAKRRIETLNLDSRAVQGKIASEKAYQQAAKITAESIGNTIEAFESEIRIKELDRRSTLESIRVKQEEARIDLAAAEQRREEAIRLNEFQGDKKLEIESRLENAKAKLREADAGRDAIKIIDAEIEALRRRQQQVSGSAGSGTAGDLSASTTARNKTKLTSPGPTYDKENFATDTGGQRITGGTFLPAPPGDGWKWIADLNSGWPYGGYWKRGNEIYSGTPGNQPVNRDGLFNRSFSGFGLLTANPGSGTYNFDGTPEAYNNRGVGNTIEQDLAANFPAVKTTDTYTFGPTTPGGKYTVDIRVNGGPATSIETASSGDAQALTNLLRQLGNDANRTGP